MGYLRFCFAITVTINHLWWSQVTGFALVYGFYCISGFWIAKIIHEVYGETLRGKGYFLLNRIVRIYPTYYICLLVSLICLWLIPDAYKLNSALKMPSTFWQWLPQLFVFGLNEPGIALYPVRLLPTAWSLNTELFYYVLMCLFIGTSFKRTVIWFVASVALSLYLLCKGYDFRYHYYTLYGPSTCFAAGAMLYNLRSYMARIPMLSRWPAIALGILVPFFPGFLGFGTDMNAQVYYLYISIPLFIYIIACLAKPGAVSPVEQTLTDMSYLLFIVHWPVAALFFHDFKPYSFVFWLTSTAFTTLITFAIVKVTATVLRPLRARIRGRANQKAAKQLSQM